MNNVEPNLQPNKSVPLVSVDALRQLQMLKDLLAALTPRVIACSGGIDSLLLSTIAHRQQASATVIAHAVSPAVPMAATARVKQWAAQEGWNLQIVISGEFRSEEYLSNPVNRCYYCKSNLYDALEQLKTAIDTGAILLSGANLDDLGEYRPGLIAAAENNVRHPLVEAGINKATIRTIAHHLQLPFADLPASPCLASRLYTGTRVTPERLRAVELAEVLIRHQTDIDVVRCRIRETEMFIEVGNEHRSKITPALIKTVLALVQINEPCIVSVQLDPEAYRPGRAFIGAS